MSRIKQFFSAVMAEIHVKEKSFVKKNLTETECELFFSMAIFDQKHAINVANTALDLVKDKEVDLTLLIKAALLHDVGRKKGDLSITDKVMMVLLDKYMPEKTVNWSRRGKGNRIDNLRHAAFTYYYHPERSAELLMNIGASRKLADIVKKHHKIEDADDCEELKILRIADSLN